MHTCTSCAQDALIGIDAANICTSCGAVSTTVAEAGVSPVMLATVVLTGAAILAAQALKSVWATRTRKLATA